MKKEAVVLLNMGGPNNLHEVEVFLTNMFNDKNIITVKCVLLRKFIAAMITFTRTESSQEIYRKLGGKSPLVGHTKKLVAKLQEKLGGDVYVDFAMRYTPPFSDEVIQKIYELNVEKIYLIPLYPQLSSTTTKSSLEDFYQKHIISDSNAILVEKKFFYLNNTYNQAVVQTIKDKVSIKESEEFDIIFSAHGLPVKIIKAGDHYEKHVNHHVKLLTQMLKEQNMNFKNFHLAYQSKVGPMAWLTPSLEDKLKEISNKKVLIVPVAFTIDNSETDFELEIEYREVAQELGYEDYRVSRCPNDSDLFVDALTQMYHEMKS